MRGTCGGDKVAPHLRGLEEQEEDTEVSSDDYLFVLVCQFSILTTHLRKTKRITFHRSMINYDKQIMFPYMRLFQLIVFNAP